MSATRDRAPRGPEPRRRSAAIAGVTAMMFLLLPAMRPARAGISLFDPENDDHLKKDASHFQSGSAHVASWKEWWYFNFHAPNVENGWDGLIVFHTSGDLGATLTGDKVKVVMGIWNGGVLRIVDFNTLLQSGIPLSSADGYSSSTTQCDVSVQVATGRKSTAKYDRNKDEYKVHVENATGTLVVDLTYTRITKGFLPDMKGFSNDPQGWRELYWAVPMPYANVSGTITLPVVGQKNIDGTGYHDHNWGYWDNDDAAWDWGECPIPASNATIIFGKVSGDNTATNYGNVGVVVAVDANGFVAWGEHPDIDVTYKGAWGQSGVKFYPQIDHVYAKGGGKIIDIESQVVYYLAPSQLGWIVEILAGYAGKVFGAGTPNDSLLTAAPATSRGFLEYKDSNGEADRQAPGAPTNLAVTAPANNCTQLDLTWTAPGGEAATGYNIYRGNQAGGPYHYRGTVTNGTNYRDGPCAAGIQYFYKVTAYDGVPNEGAFSAAGNGTTNTGCAEICTWPRPLRFWGGEHMPFFPDGAGTFTGGIQVGNLGSTVVYDAHVEMAWGTPSTGAGLNSYSLTYGGSEDVSYIPPYGEVTTGPFSFTTPPEGNDFGQPYWMIRATVVAPTGQFSTGMPWDDPNVSVLNRWDVNAKAGDPFVLNFWMENSDTVSALMKLDIDRSSCPARWSTAVEPYEGVQITVQPGDRVSAVLTVVPTGGTIGSVHVVQSQYTLDGQFVRLAGGLTLTLTPTPMGDTNGDGVVDLLDFPDFEACLAGPSTTPPFSRCVAVFDYEGDDDVDLADFGEFQESFSAP